MSHSVKLHLRFRVIPHEDARFWYGRAPVTVRYQGRRTKWIRGNERRSEETNGEANEEARKRTAETNMIETPPPKKGTDESGDDYG